MTQFEVGDEVHLAERANPLKVTDIVTDHVYDLEGPRGGGYRIYVDEEPATLQSHRNDSTQFVNVES